MKRPRRNPVIIAALAVAAVAAAANDSRAVILYEKQERNTSPPTGALANAGWQYEGGWGLFLGTPIAPHYFITAEHVGGFVGLPFLSQGNTYNTTAFYDTPNADLRIWKVAETFPTYAPLYNTA